MASLTGENVSDAASNAGSVTQQTPLTAMTAKSSQRPTTKSKKDQLLALVAKPAGAKVSLLTERLGWQAHTVRAAISGLRKQGHLVLATKAQKTGEAVYRLVPSAQVTADDPQVVSSEA